MSECQCNNCKLAASIRRCEELIEQPMVTREDFAEEFAAMDGAIADLQQRGLLPPDEHRRR